MPIAATQLDVQTPTASEDDYGDVVQSWTTTYQDVRANLTERRKRVWSPTEARALTVTYHEAILPSEVVLQKGDRIVTDDGRFLHVTHAWEPASLAFPGATQRVELEDLDA